VANVYGFNNCTLWERVKVLFDEYAVMSFMFEYQPTNMVGEMVSSMGSALAPQGLIGYTRHYEDLNTYDITGFDEPKEMACPSFKMFDPKQTYKTFRDNRALARSQNAAWKSTSANQQLSNGLPQASFCFKCSVGDAGRYPAYVKVSWMVMVRGQKY